MVLGHWQPTGPLEGRGPFPRSTLDVNELHHPLKGGSGSDTIASGGATDVTALPFAKLCTFEE